MALGSLRNKNCYCGSGKKFKKCHLYIDSPKDIADLNKKISGWMVTQTIEKMKHVEPENEAPVTLTTSDEPIQDVANTLSVAVNESIKANEHIGS